MENQELINKLCKLLIDKKFYVDTNTISIVCSYLTPSAIEKIIDDITNVVE